MDYRIYSVHGTFAADRSQRGNRWWQRESPFSDAVLSYLDTDTFRVNWEPFRWSGENKSSERGQAAAELAQVLAQIEHRSNKVALIGHSHGGNILYSALNIAERRFKIPKLPTVTIGTPFIPEPLANPWMFENLPKLWRIFAIVVAVCVIGLWFTEAGTMPSQLLVACLALATVICGFSLYFKLNIAFMSAILTGPFRLKIESTARFIFKDIKKQEGRIRLENIRFPKIYSLNDEAINALRAAPMQKVSLVTTEIAFFPASFLLSVFVFIAGTIASPHVSVAIPGDVAADLAALSEDISQEGLAWLNDLVKPFILLALSIGVGLLGSRLFLAEWIARIFNIIFTRIAKERAYGRDTGISRALPMLASANLPRTTGSYGESELWKPLPKSLDDELDKITAASAVSMFRAIRETLGMGLTTGNYTFGETLSTNFRGDELVHSAYFEHPEIPGFIAWILCEFYGFPKGDKYSTLPIDKFQEWWDAIRPDPWPDPAEQSAEADGQSAARSGGR